MFAQPHDALVAAADVVRRLAAEAWPTPARLAVRAAVHIGPAPARRSQYYGPAVNLATSLRALAHPGQVLVSAAAAGEAGPLPDDLGLRDVGTHRFGSGDRPAAVYQLVGGGMADEFPPLASLDAASHNLPRRRDEFIGREEERAHLAKAIEATRLVTVTGPGGTGKARLALELAVEVAPAYANGVWLVELAGIADAALIPSAVAQAVGVPMWDGRPPARAVEDYLRHKTILLVLDNCEHLVPDIAGVVAPWLAAAPKMRVLATSRRSLGITAEQLFPVGPLEHPDPVRPRSVEDLAGYDAVALFLARGRAVRPGFVLDDATAPSVVALCARLEGIPLALELAAARLRDVDPGSLAQQLADRLAVVAVDRRDGWDSVRSAVDWSWKLLAPAHRVAFRRLALFAGGFDLPAAEIVASGGDLDGDDVLDALVELVDVSLVVADYDRARYRMLETVREYAGEKLTSSGEAEVVRDRHLLWLAVAFEPGYLAGTISPRDLAEQLDVELDNVRAALGGSLAAGRPDGLRLAGVLPFLFQVKGHVAEAMSTLASQLDAFPDAPPLWRARALAGLAFLNMLARTGEGVRYSEDALQLAEEHALDEWWVFFTMGTMAERDATFALRGRELALERGFVHPASYCCQQLAVCAERRGHLDEAARWLEEGINLLPPVCMGRGRLLASFAYVVQGLGQWDRARQIWEECLTIAVTLGDRVLEPSCHLGAGRFAVEDGDFSAAEDHFHQAVEIGRDLGMESLTACGLVALSELAVWRGEWAQATRYAEQAVEGRAHSFVACFLSDLAHAVLLDGDRVAARRVMGEALETSRAKGDHEHEARALATLAILALEDCGDSDDGKTLLARALFLLERESKDHLDVALQATAMRAFACDRRADAARFLGAAAAVRTFGRPSWHPPRRTALLADLAATLGAGRLDALFAEGRSWSRDEALQRARDEVT